MVGFDEVATVHGKAGRAETATDPAQLDMIESVVTLKPRDKWPLVATPRWYSAWAPEWMKGAFRSLWPEQRRRTLSELARDLDSALQMPGYQMAIAPPIRTRIDMLTTGVRTPVGTKVFGPTSTASSASASNSKESVMTIPKWDMLVKHRTGVSGAFRSLGANDAG